MPSTNKSVYNTKTVEELRGMIAEWERLIATAENSDVKNVLTDCISKAKKEIAKKEKKPSERSIKIAENRATYEATHIYFETKYSIDKAKKKILGGFVFDFEYDKKTVRDGIESVSKVVCKAIALTNYTADGFIVICSDKNGGCFIRLCTKCKENKGAQYSVKKQLIDKTSSLIRDNIATALRGRAFSEILTIAKASKNFRGSCKNNWIIDRVKDTVKLGAKYEPKEVEADK